MMLYTVEEITTAHRYLKNNTKTTYIVNLKNIYLTNDLFYFILASL